MTKLVHVRAQFPLLRNHADLAYLDNASSTQKPQCVIDSLVHTYSYRYANVHRGIYRLSAETSNAYEAVREKVQLFLGAQHSEEIIFVRGATEGVNLVAYSYAMPRLKAGDIILVSALEHHANLVPWQQVAQHCGAEIQVIPLDATGRLDQNHYAALLNPRVKIVALTHASNVTGVVPPVAQMIAQAHAVGAVVLLDGAQALAHMHIDVRALDCDFYVCSSHKMYGPTGIGALYCKQSLWPQMRPYQTGGNMIETVRYDRSTFAQPPHLFEAGTPSIADTIAWGAALEFFNGLAHEEVWAHEQALQHSVLRTLNEFPGIRVLAQPDIPVIAFVHESVHAHDLGTILDSMHVAIRSGHHCAMPLMQHYQVPACVRVSLGVYNTERDVAQLKSALMQVYQVMQLT